MESDKQEIVPNIVTENTNGVNDSIEKKALNRMVSEGYRYRVLDDQDGGDSPLDPIDEDRDKKKARRLRRIVYLLAFTIVAITCLIVVIIIQHANRHEPDKTCKTSECVKVSANILNRMDTSTDPCANFYKFSCGNWVKHTPLPPSKVKYGAFSQIYDEIQLILKQIIEDPGETLQNNKSTAIQKSKAYYKMCMNAEKIEKAGVQPILKLIHDLGSWTLTSDVTSGTLDLDKWSLQDSVLSLHKLEFSPLFQMVVTTDDKNSSKHILAFEQSGLSLGAAKDYFQNHTNQKELKEALIKFGTEFLVLLGNNNTKSQVTDLYNFEQQLAHIFIPKDQLLDPVKNYNKMTLQAFQDNYLGKWLNLKQYVDGIFGDIQTVPMDTEVLVYTPAYFQRLDKLLGTVDRETLANYMVMHGVSFLTGYLNEAMLEVALRLDKVELGLKEYPPRWKRCLEKTMSSFGFAVSALFVQDHFNADSRDEVEDLFEEIRKAFIDNLKTVDWMDKVTKDYAKKKAEAVQKRLGFPDYVLDQVKLDERYENISLIAGNLFETKLQINRFYREKNLRLLPKVPDRKEWSMYPSEVNGYYSSDFNQIVFPAGILRPPLYNPTSPKSFNFGSFGMICGHELTHGFDDRGRRYDLNGNMREWWTNASAANFNEQTKCFVDFYHNYVAGGTHLDGENTLSENIADNGGMRVAYLAYQTWNKSHTQSDTLTLPGLDYSPDQLFFIGMAQVWCSKYTDAYLQQAILTDSHAISKYRVLGPMSNSEFFAKAFNCPVDSPMNPTHKCRVW